jgi:tRNA (guanine-N7-)-methyltransferase
LGCDPYLGGSINIHKQIQKLNLKNLFITNLEFFELYEFVKELKFNNITILFPDPWPKKKHLKRRLINYKFVQYITKLSNKRTKVIVSTDDEDYLNQIIYAFHKSSEFTLSTNLINENIMKYFNVQITKYYKKAKLDNRKSYFLLFEKEIS